MFFKTHSKSIYWDTCTALGEGAYQSAWDMVDNEVALISVNVFIPDFHLNYIEIVLVDLTIIFRLRDLLINEICTLTERYCQFTMIKLGTRDCFQMICFQSSKQGIHASSRVCKDTSHLSNIK